MQPLRVIKLGGSLFDFPQLRPAFRAWQRTVTPARQWLIAGGGPWADAIRQLDQDQHLGESAAHWLCIDALSLTARIVAELLELDPPDSSGMPLEREATTGTTPGRPQVLDVSTFLRRREPTLPGAALPHGWHVTTDSIAARVAELAGASELVLLKSAPPPAAGLADLVAAGYVDQYFERAARPLRHVQFVDLRGFRL